MKRLSCPQCGSDEIAESVHAYTTLITPVGVFVDDAGNVQTLEEGPGDHEVQDVERDDARVFCQDCGFEADYELEEFNPVDPAEEGPTWEEDYV